MSKSMPLVTVQVKPNSKKGDLVQPDLEGNLVVFTRQPAVEGRANAAVISLVAAYFEVATSQVHIIRGQTSRRKVVEVNT